MKPLELAQAIESSLSFLWDGVGRRPAGQCEASCHALPRDIAKTVRGSLLSLSEFLDYTPKRFALRGARKRQYARALWLTLLAELAERGELTLEGLK